LTIEATFFYQAPQVYGFMDLMEMSSFNIGVQKNMLRKRLTAKLSANDIFYKSYQNGASYFTDYTQVFYTRNDTRIVSVSLVYRFGKNTVAPVRKHSSGAEDEKRRMSNSGS
jgi:hypothetical protein